jgi:predicted metal-dependent hydrolase
MMRAVGTLSDVRGIASGLDLLWGRTGVFRKIIPRYLDYYRPGFHPSQHDYDDVVGWAKERYLGERA